MFIAKGTMASFIMSCIVTYGSLLENILVIIFMITKYKWLLNIIGSLAVLCIGGFIVLLYYTVTNRNTTELISEDEEEL